jgi:hypothetical protein
MSDGEDFIMDGQQALDFLEAEISGLKAQIIAYQGMLKSAEEQYLDLKTAIALGHEIQIRVMPDDGSLD